jgi:hypothetical protein
MHKFAKFFTVLGAAAVFGCASSQQSDSDYAKWQLLDEYEASMPVLVGWGDYGSASRVALAIASERSKLEGATPEVCQALSQARDLQLMASEGRSREDFQVLAGLQDRAGSMTRERATCAHAQEVAARGSAAGF